MAAPNKRLYPRSREKKPGGMKYPIVSRKAGVLIAMALELPGSIIGGLFIGYLLDNYFNTSPWIMMALTTLGFTAACIRLVRWARYFADERSKTESADGERSTDRSAANLKK
jgi:F0F1-type ATP synthase assembly protein I